MNTSSQENLTTHNSEQLHVEHRSEVDARFSHGYSCSSPQPQRSRPQNFTAKTVDGVTIDDLTQK